MGKHLLKRLGTLCLLACLAIAGYADDATTETTTVERTIYKTKFQEWTAASASTTESTVTVTDNYDRDIIFYLYDTKVDPEGTHDKFTQDCITTGYLMASKSADPYIKTSAIPNVTTITWVHAATGSSRGWGLKVKGDGDDDWVTISDAVADPAGGTEVTVEVNRDNVELWFYNLNSAQNAYMTSLEINGNVEVAARTFTDFTIDFRDETTQAPIVVVPEDGVLPDGVELSEGTWHDSQHGTSNATITVPVDGPVQFQIGGCQYSTNQATVSIDGGDAITIDTQSAGCDNGYGTYTKYATYTYNVEAAATLTFSLGTYCPYFIAQACDYIEDVTVSYYDTTGDLLEEVVVAGNSELTYAEQSAKVTVPDGQAFRGWFDSSATTGLKVSEGTALTEDTKLYAKATDIEVATVGSHFDYDMTKKYWYVEDHELIDIDGSYYNNHGWKVSSNGTIKVQVAGKAYVNIENCLYSTSQTVTVTDASGNEIDTFDAQASSDGATTAVQYDGDATTLTFTFPSGAYVHGIEVYNVEDFVEYNETTGYYEIASGDASSLLLALKTASEGQKIFVPDGTYDLGETVLTTISANNVSLIGESMDGTIIKNAPDISTEGIGTTATILNTSSNLYIQDLTIQNAMEFDGGTGRAVTIQDKGQRTICKNVALLSYQDTYYSNKASQFYFEDGEIHGVVDYVCGDGDVFYNRVKFVNEAIKNTTIAAPNTTSTCTYGYVMYDCTIETLCSTFNFGRSWGGVSRLAWINTTINQPSKIISSRFTTAGMNIAADKFVEYNSVDTLGNVVSPSSNELTFTHSSGDNTYETILTAEEAAEYTVDKVFTDWDPVSIASQVEVTEVTITDGVMTWSTAEESSAYAILDATGKIIDITTDTSYTVEDATAVYGVRAANARGGFGVGLFSDGTSTAITAVSAQGEQDIDSVAYYNLGGVKLSQPQDGVNIVVVKYADGSKKSYKVIK